MKDQLNRTIQIDSIPERIVSLVPSQTELLFDMGLESTIVGISKFCVHPSHLLKEKTIVGGTKVVHFDKIRALNPDIILCNKEENTPEMIKELETIATVHISDIYSIDDCLELIEMYGHLFSKESEADDIKDKIKGKLEEFKLFMEDKPFRNTAYFIWKTPWMVVARETFINELLTINNFENYYNDLKRYPEIELIDGKAEDVELVLLSSEPFPFKNEHEELLRPFYPRAKFLIVDGEYFSWYGTRLIEAFDYFKSLHQDLLN